MTTDRKEPDMGKLTESEYKLVGDAVDRHFDHLTDLGESTFDLLGGWEKIVQHQQHAPLAAHVSVYERGGGWAVELVSSRTAVELWYVHPQPDPSKPPVFLGKAAENNARGFARRVAYVLDVEVKDG